MLAAALADEPRAASQAHFCEKGVYFSKLALLIFFFYCFLTLSTALLDSVISSGYGARQILRRATAAPQPREAGNSKSKSHKKVHPTSSARAEFTRDYPAFRKITPESAKRAANPYRRRVTQQRGSSALPSPVGTRAARPPPALRVSSPRPGPRRCSGRSRGAPMTARTGRPPRAV